MPAIYEPNAAVTSEDFPENHRVQIEDALRSYFGTPSSPHFRLPNPDAGEDEPVLVDVVSPATMKLGAEVYQQRCVQCHGVNGDGAGIAAQYLYPKPRDYRRGLFKFTSTNGQLKPRRDDLLLTLRRGVKGTSMPKFPHLTDQELSAVVDYVIMLSYRGEMELILAELESPDADPDDLEPDAFTRTVDTVKRSWDMAEDPDNLVLPHDAMPKQTEERLLSGQKLFLDATNGCWKCHGKDGRGQTFGLDPNFIAAQLALPAAQRQISVDAWGNIAPAADLTTGMFHGGRRPVDIYRRIYAGVKGTPMAGNGETRFREDPDKIWDLVHYVLAVSDGTAPPAPAETPADGDTQPADAPADNSGG